MKRMVITNAILIVVCALTGCTAPTQLQLRAEQMRTSPIRVDSSKPVAFHRVIFKLEPGKVIGAHHDGLARVRKVVYNWQSGISAGSEEFRVTASEELRNLGYTVLGAESLLFGEDESVKARYQLGGIIQDIQYNTYAPLAGGFSEANIQVEWQLLDTLKKTVIFNSTTSGYGKQSDVTAGVIMLAFRDSIHQLMATREFVNVLHNNREDNDNKPLFAEVVKIAMPKTEKSLVLPNDIESIMQGIILIKVGRTHASGFIISNDGYALTAAHVVSGTKEVTVQMKSGLEVPSIGV